MRSLVPVLYYNIKFRHLNKCAHRIDYNKNRSITLYSVDAFLSNILREINLRNKKMKYIGLTLLCGSKNILRHAIYEYSLSSTHDDKIIELYFLTEDYSHQMARAFKE